MKPKKIRKKQKLDYGFQVSEEMLIDLEKKIHKEYAQASKEFTAKAKAYFDRFKKEDAEMMQKFKKGEITKKQYAEWRTRKMQRGQYFSELKKTLASDLTNVDKIAMSYVNDKTVDVYALNMNYGTYLIEHEARIDTSFSLYNKEAVKALIKDNPKLLPIKKDIDIPLDKRWNMQHIQSVITQGILQGESIPNLAKRMQRVVGMDEKAAIRNARTSMTGAQNLGRYNSMKRAKDKGVGVKKGWLATLDMVTRNSHVQLDGEIQDIDKPFSNGLMYPADSSGRPEEVWNCRCRLVHQYDKYSTDWSNVNIRRNDKLGGMTYEEWKNKHKVEKVLKGSKNGK